MLVHSCGYKADLYCKRCEKPLICNERTGLYCPSCGREVTLVCPGCGKRW